MTTPRQRELDTKSDELHKNIIEGITGPKRLAIVEAPPGSGKTFMLLRVLSSLADVGWRVAVAAQTNKQADDISRQLAGFPGYCGASVVRFTSKNYIPSIAMPHNVRLIEKTDELPTGPQVIISTSAKWGFVGEVEEFDLLAVDEAWQMNWATLMQCGNLAGRYLLIGDPGQIPPVTTVNVNRWGTSDRAPHKAAPIVALSDTQFEETRFHGKLPACRRLPAEAVPFVKMFYDFDFDAYAENQERAFVAPTTDSTGGINDVLGKLSDLKPVVATIPTPTDGPPASVDIELARTISKIADALITEGIQIRTKEGGALSQVSQADIGVTSTHRAMNGAIRKALGPKLSQVVVDTPERWQGLEKPIMIAVHPLSGVTEPSEFDLETGRLCVMTSRQTAGLILVTRDHVGETIVNTIPAATQAPGEPDRTGRGRRAHLEFWEMVEQNGRLVSLS